MMPCLHIVLNSASFGLSGSVCSKLAVLEVDIGKADAQLNKGERFHKVAAASIL
jgi:hypothetical protein